MEVWWMNPDQTRSGTTLSSSFKMGLWVSAIIPVLAIIVLAVLSSSLSGTAVFIVAAVVAIITLIVVFGIQSYVRRNINSQLSSLAEVCRSVVNGDRSIRAVVNGDDELAQLSSALNSMLDNQGSASNVVAGTTGNDAAALQAQIEKLLQEVSAVGDGDLRVQAEVTPDTLGVLADSFNYMIEELAKVVGRVQSTAVQVTNATRRILDRSAELAQASETQVKQIAQTTEAVEALAVFIQTVARNAQLSVEVAQEALSSASEGQHAVRQSIEGMMLIRENVQETAKKIKRLGERSNEIGEIVRIIEDIADQTNLLALNAAIQSAMAGEHGRGFAVVADEIRLLAERSTESTKRIATLVKSIQGDTYEAVVAMEDSTQEVVKGSQLADDAGRSLNSIYSAVERQAQMIESIARAANEQTSVSEAVAVAMGRISEITRQSDAGTQEAAVSVSYLAELSEQLRASVSTFRLPDRTNDMLGSFSNMTSFSEMPESGDQSLIGSLGIGAVADSSWGQGQGQGQVQGISGTFPPLPESGNTGSLVPLTSRSGQFALNNQQDFSQFPGSPSGVHAPLSSPPSFGSSQPLGNQGNGNNQMFFGGSQLDFGDLGQFDGQQNGNLGFDGGQFNQSAGFVPGQAVHQGQNPDFGQQISNPGFGQQISNPGFGQQISNPGFGQQISNPGFGQQISNPGFGQQIPNSGLLPSPFQQPQQGQAPGNRPRWQNGSQPEQNPNQ
jgi:methyl-accepting chemotaxis protein